MSPTFVWTGWWSHPFINNIWFVVAYISALLTLSFKNSIASFLPAGISLPLLYQLAISIPKTLSIWGAWDIFPKESGK